MKLKKLIELLQNFDEDSIVELDYNNNVWVSDKKNKSLFTLKTLIKDYEEKIKKDKKK